MTELPGTGGEFTAEQRRYLEGFASGVLVGRQARNTGQAVNIADGSPAAAAKTEAEPVGPEAVALKAQDRFVTQGKKLSDQETFKRDLHPFDGYEKLKAQAAQ